MPFFVSHSASSATFSEDRKYRYSLTRVWAPTEPVLAVVMYNPSVGSENSDDPTIRRIVSFARRECYGGIVITNLHALVAQVPRALKSAYDPVGPDNPMVLTEAIRQAFHNKTSILCAWGQDTVYGETDKYFMEKAKDAGVVLVCLGVTNSGRPRHPLYIRADQPFELFKGY